MAESESEKQRRPNFSTYEIEVLVSEIGKNEELATGIFGSTINLQLIRGSNGNE